MFDLLGDTELRKDMTDVVLHTQTQITAICIVLITKGICTVEELGNAMAQATAHVDQVAAHAKDEARAEFDAKHPGLRTRLDKLFGVTEDQT